MITNSSDNKQKDSQQKSAAVINSGNGISLPAVSVLQQKEETEIVQQISVHKKEKLQLKANNTGLPDNLKSGVENLSGMDLSDVKVHYNSSEPAQLNALAYAQGNNIHIGSGQEKHLAHEAWHVVQQRQGRVQATKQMKQGVAVNDDPELEHEADVMGEKALAMGNQETIVQQKKESILGQNTGSEIVQGKLIYYTTASIPVEVKLSTYDEVVNAFKGRKSAGEVKAKLTEEINKLFVKEESVNSFNDLLIDQFIAAEGDDYLNTGNLAELVDSLFVFYKKGLVGFLKKSSDIEKKKLYTDLKDLYTETEGDDGLSVGTEYDSNLACTLHALLAVKGSYLGASTPAELHKVLRSMDKFKGYDDDAIVGLIRMQAGLTYSTAFAGYTVKEMTDELVLKDRGRKFIIDLDGEPHTFALKYTDDWKRFDNGSTSGYNTAAEIGKYKSSKISVTWE